jgi:hypothetical protein
MSDQSTSSTTITTATEATTTTTNENSESIIKSQSQLEENNAALAFVETFNSLLEQKDVDSIEIKQQAM